MRNSKWTTLALTAVGLLAAGPAFASTVVVPEPSMTALMVAVGGGLYLARRLRSR